MWYLIAALGYFALMKPKATSKGQCTCSVDPSCCADEAAPAPSRAQTMKTSLARKTGRYG
jgi:hypothetical protein